MFDCFQAWKLAKNQSWKHSNMACSTSAEEDLQAKAALLLFLHWSYSHQPDFLDEDTEQSTGAQMHCEDAIAKWCWYYCNTSSWLSQYDAFFGSAKILNLPPEMFYAQCLTSALNSERWQPPLVSVAHNISSTGPPPVAETTQNKTYQAISISDNIDVDADGL